MILEEEGLSTKIQRKLLKILKVRFYFISIYL